MSVGEPGMSLHSVQDNPSESAYDVLKALVKLQCFGDITEKTDNTESFRDKASKITKMSAVYTYYEYCECSL